MHARGIGRTTAVNIEGRELAYKYIEQPIVVVIEPYRARAPPTRADSSLLSYVGKGAVTVVAIKDVALALGYVDIGETVIVIVADRHPLPEAPAHNTGFKCDVGKRAVAIVPV